MQLLHGWVMRRPTMRSISALSSRSLVLLLTYDIHGVLSQTTAAAAFAAIFESVGIVPGIIPAFSGGVLEVQFPNFSAPFTIGQGFTPERAQYARFCISHIDKVAQRPSAFQVSHLNRTWSRSSLTKPWLLSWSTQMHPIRRTTRPQTSDTSSVLTSSSTSLVFSRTRRPRCQSSGIPCRPRARLLIGK
jgi:hypothetical protein